MSTCARAQFSSILSALVFSIHILPLLVSVVAFDDVTSIDITTIDGTGSTVQITAWFNYAIYQQSLSASIANHTYSLNTLTNLGPSHCHKSPSSTHEAKIMIDNTGTNDAIVIGRIALYTASGTWYGISGRCIDDALLETQGWLADLPKWTDYTTDELSCASGRTNIWITIDDEKWDAQPPKQIFYFDTTRPNEFIPNATWTDGTNITPDIRSCDPTSQPTKFPAFNTINPTKAPSTSPTPALVAQTPMPTPSPSDSQAPSDPPTLSPTYAPTAFLSTTTKTAETSTSSTIESTAASTIESTAASTIESTAASTTKKTDSSTDGTTSGTTASETIYETHSTESRLGSQRAKPLNIIWILLLVFALIVLICIAIVVGFALFVRHKKKFFSALSEQQITAGNGVEVKQTKDAQKPSEFNRTLGENEVNELSLQKMENDDDEGHQGGEVMMSTEGNAVTNVHGVNPDEFIVNGDESDDEILQEVNTIRY